MLPQMYVRDASPQPRVTTVRHGQTNQVSPTQLDPLLCMNHTQSSHQHHHQRHQTLSRRHCKTVSDPRVVSGERNQMDWWLRGEDGMCSEQEGCTPVIYEMNLRRLL